MFFKVPGAGVAAAVFVAGVMWCGVNASELQEPFSARVARVIDGDTISVRSGDSNLRVRLAGVDAPEEGQSYSRNARRALERLVHRKMVEVSPVGTTDGGILLARVSLSGTGDVSAEMVRQGFAWAIPEGGENSELKSLERAAREGRRGLWADIQEPVPPWEW